MKKKLYLPFFLLMLLSSVMNAQTDMTYKIQNANLSSNDGWTITCTEGYGWATQKGWAPYKVNEAYAGWGALTLEEYAISQKIILPKGAYELSAYGFYRYGESYSTDPSISNAVLYAGEDEVAVVTLGSIEGLGSYANSVDDASSQFSQGNYLNKLSFNVMEDDTEVEIGFKGTHDLMRSWFVCGPFQLIQVSDTPIIASDYPILSYKSKNGNITVNADTRTISSGERVEPGTPLTFTLIPDTDCNFLSLNSQYFVIGDDAQVQDRSIDINRGDDVTDNAIYNTSTGTYTYTCVMPSENLYVNAIFIPKTDISSATVSDISSSYTYTGLEQTPIPTLIVNSSTVPSSEYEVSYSNNFDVGTATITITANALSDLYKGTKTVNFDITKAPLEIKADDQVLFNGDSPSIDMTNTTVIGLMGNDRLGGITLTVTDDIIIPSSAIIMNGNNNVTSNYEITYENGNIIEITQNDNIIYVEDVKSNNGRNLTLYIKMKNSVPIQTFQFDLFLPEGVSIVTDNYGFIMLDLNPSYSRIINSFGSNILNNGALRVLGNSTSGYTIPAGESTLATLVIWLPEDLAPGDYPLIIRNTVLSDNTSTGYRVDFIKTILSIRDFTFGDLNYDGRIDAVDLNALTNIILENVPEGVSFSEKAADFNNDGVIDAVDLNALTNFILQGSDLGSSNTRKAVLVGEIR